MKKILLLAVLLSSITYSCFPDDSDSGADDGPITVTVRFEVVVTRDTEAVITTTIDEATESEDVDEFSFNKIYTDVEVEVGTFLRLTYLENGEYVVDDQGSNWTDYTAILNIYVNGASAASEIFNITEDDAGLRDIIYTFN